jgi:CRP-like cAMP-binding protein
MVETIVIEEPPLLQPRLVEISRDMELGLPSRSSRRGSVSIVDRRPERRTHQCQTQAFGTLSPAERMWLSEHATHITVKQGRILYTPSQPSEAVFVLRHGKVTRYHLTPEGRKLVVATLESPAIFGAMGSFGQEMYGCFAEAATDCQLCVLSRSNLQALVRRNPEIGLHLLAELGKRLQQREDALESLAFRALPARLASLLLEEANDCGSVAGLSHQDLAERLGTYRETVSQVVGRFRDEGLIAVGQRYIRILDRTGLDMYSQM